MSITLCFWKENLSVLTQVIHSKQETENTPGKPGLQTPLVVDSFVSSLTLQSPKPESDHFYPELQHKECLKIFLFALFYVRK